MSNARELAEVATSYVAGNITGRNRIINGDMRISQRLGTSSRLCSDIVEYTLDRWLVISSPQSKLTVQQNAGSVAPPAGFSNYLGLTVTTAETIDPSDFFNLIQFIEGYNIADLSWGTASAKAVTVSFWVRSSVTGTYSFAFRNNGETRSYVTTYNINAANTWEQKTITIPGDTSGTWNVTNGRGIEVNYDFGRGSETTTANAWTSSGNVRLAGTVKLVENASATWQITGVQLEEGSVATPFEHRQYGQELALCQRYCQVFYRSLSSDSLGMSFKQGSNYLIAHIAYQPMRSIPTWANPPTSWDATGSPSSTQAGAYDFTSGSYVTINSGSLSVINQLSLNHGRLYLQSSTTFSGGSGGGAFGISLGADPILTAEL